MQLGDSHQANYLPILEWKTAYDPFHIAKFNVYTRERDRCSFTLDLAEGTTEIDILTVHQFLDKKLAVVWTEIPDETIDPLRYYTKITAIDAFNCSSSTKILNIAQAGKMVKFYADNFDIFSTGLYDKNVTRISYDIDGNHQSEPVNMFFDSDSFFRIFPASIESPGKGFFIFTLTDGNGKLSFVEPDGKEFKRLENFDRGLRVSKIVSDLDRAVRVICWAGFDKSAFAECAKFNEFGDEIWRMKTACSHGDEPFYVRQLEGDGVLLMSLQYNSTLQVIEMQPNAGTLKSSYPINSDLLVNNVKVVDFNETSRTFTIFWVSGGSVATDVALAKYSFPSKAEKDLN